jgi:RNA polymerase sigma-70 factor, ECF subfamily
MAAMTGSAPAHAQSTLTAFASIERMLERAAQGDAVAMLELFDATAGRVLGLVSRVVGPGPVAHDVTSGCYESIWTGEERPVAGSTLPWLMEVAHRRAVTEHRGVVPRQRTGAAPATQPSFPPDPGWLPMLTEDERQALSHVYLRGRTHEETDTRLDLPAGTTIQRLHEAMLHLATEVNAELEAVSA